MIVGQVLYSFEKLYFLPTVEGINLSFLVIPVSESGFLSDIVL